MTFRHLWNFSLWLYVVGVVGLIIRNNSYPWPIKRASDILFFISAVFAIPFIVKERHQLKKLKIVFWPILLLTGGVALATILRIITGHPSSSEGILEAFRIFEVIMLFLLAGTFTLLEPKFLPRVLFAQLSTLAYSIIFLLPYSISLSMDRFQLFENWPSNVSYYLIVSLLFITTLIFTAWKEKKAMLVPSFGAATLLLCFLLWTQTRASWIGFFLATLILLGFWIRNNWRAALLTVCSLVVAGIIGSLLLPSLTKGDVIHRLLPGIELSPEKTRTVVPSTFPTPLFRLEDPTRLTLWHIYSQRLMRQPWGQGVEYDPVNIGNGPQGPHNTLLEIMVLGGFFGLAGFIAIFYLAFKNLSSKLTDNPNQLYRFALLGSLVALFVASLFDNLGTFRLLWVFLALGVFFGKKGVV